MSRTAIGGGWLAGIVLMMGLLQPDGAVAANAAPVASDLTITNVSGWGKSFMVSATDDTVSSYQLVYSIVRPPSNGTVVSTYPTYHPLYTGYMTYTSTLGFTGQDSFTFKANDGTNDSNIATVTIQVNSNLAPVVQDCSFTGVVGSAISVTLPGSDDGLSLYQLAFSAVQPPSNGTVHLANPTYYPQYSCFMVYSSTTYTVGQDLFTFKANDGLSDSAIATCRVTVLPNSAPVSKNQWVTNTPATGRQGIILSYTHGDAGQPMSWTLADGPLHGTLEYASSGYLPVPLGAPVNSDYWCYTATPGYAGPDSFTWTVSDGIATSALATVSLFVKTNNPPVARDAARSVIMGSVSNGFALPFTHPDSGQPMSYALVTAPTHGTLLSYTNNTSWSYTPAPGFSGPDAFTWSVSDSLAASTATVSITVITLSEPSAAPAFNAGVRLMDGTNTLRIWRRATGAKFDFADNKSPATGSMAAPELADWNNDGLLDLLVGQADGRVALFINKGTPRQPAFNGYEYLRLQNSSYIQVPHGCVCRGGGPSCAAPRVTDWNGDGKKDLIVGEWGSVAQWTPIWGADVYLNEGVDEAPVFTRRITADLKSTLPSQGICASGRGTTMPFVTDMNGDGVTDVISGDNNVWFSVSGLYGSTGAPSGIVNIFLGTRNDHGPGAAPVAADGSYNPVESFDSPNPGYAYPTVTVTGACPVASRKSVVAVDWSGRGKKDLVTGLQDGTVWFAPNVGSADLPVFTNHYRLQAGGVPIVVGDPARVGQDPGYRNAPSDYHGSANLVSCNEARLAVGDLDGDGREDLLVGDVNGYVTFYSQVNPEPVGLDQRVRVMPDQPKVIRLEARVDSGHSVTWRVASQPQHGILSGAAPELVYTPDAGYRGADAFTVVPADGAVEGQPGTVDILVKAHAPMALEQEAAIVTMNRARSVALHATDEGDEPLTYGIVSPPAHGACSLAGNVVTYTPDADFAGLDRFAWKATDGYLDSNIRTQVMDVTVLAVNFQTTNAPVPPGYVMDAGALYDAGRGYGWTTPDVMGGWMNLAHLGPYPLWLQANTDPRMDTCMTAMTNPTWTCSLPNGNYSVTVAYGNYSQDGWYSKFQDRIAVQGVQVVDNPENMWGGPKFAVAGSIPAAVTNGLLAVTIGGLSNTSPTRLDYLEIRSAARPAGWAAFVGEDAATQGAWQGVYGSDGHWLGNSVVSLPGYLTILGPTGYVEYDLQRNTWADPTTEARALQHPWGADRILSAWWASQGFEYDFKFVDGATHRVALYATDVGSIRNAWTQRVDVVDAGDGTVLDSRTLTAFTDGKYLVWDLRGHVKVKVMPVKGNAVVNALFFGSGASLDSNGDGLPDWWQIRHFGSVTAALARGWMDADGDGHSNLQEYLAGTDPTDPASHLAIRSIVGEANGTGFDFDSVAGLLYDVYWKTNLVDASHWQFYRSVIGTGGPAHVSFTNAVPQGFLRVKVAP